MLQKILSRVENYELTFGTWLASFVSVILLRLCLESFSAQKGDFFGLATYPHFLFFFSGTILAMILIMRLLTREAILKISKVGLLGSFLILISPVVDLFFSRGEGGLVMAYLKISNFTQIFEKYFTFFGRELTYGITYGLRIQTLAACFFVGLYVYLKTKKIRRVAAAALLVYSTIYFFSILPTLLTMAQKFSLNFDETDSLRILFLPQSLFAIKVINPLNVFDFKLCLILIPLVLFEALLWFYLYDKKKLWATLKNSRPLRLLISLMSLGAGIYLGFRLNALPWENSFFAYLLLLNLVLIPLLLWLFSVGLNDLYDQKIDVVTNVNRPLVRKILTPGETNNLNLFFLIFTNGAAFNLGSKFLSLSLILTALTYLYSKPPLRLRRFIFLSSLLIAASVVLALFMGFMLFAENQSLAAFPRNIILATLILFTLSVNSKDLKDYFGDKADHILTLPTILGQKKGKLILASLNFLTFPLVTTLLSRNFALLLLALGFGTVAFLLTYDEKTNEHVIFVPYALFMILLLVFSF